MSHTAVAYLLSSPLGHPLPSRPTRDQACAVRNQLQGITALDGSRLFDPDIASMDEAGRLDAYAKHRALGDTHINLSLDLTGLDGLAWRKAVIREAITVGGMTGVVLCCMGDGNDPGEPDHDPGALGFSWLMANFDAIVDYMEAGEDLTPWIEFCPGYDGIIPAWQPWSRVNQFVRLARARLDRLTWGRGYLAVEFSSGYWSWSGERDDLGTEDGRMIDIVLYEFPIQWGPPAAPPASLLLSDGSDFAPSATNEQRAPWTQIWLINRFLGDRYIRPSSQPKNYEPHPPSADYSTPRGRKFMVMWERSTHAWCDDHCDIALVNQQTAVVRELGAEFY